MDRSEVAEVLSKPISQELLGSAIPARRFSCSPAPNAGLFDPARTVSPGPSPRCRGDLAASPPSAPRNRSRSAA